MKKNFILKLSPAALRFFKNDAVPYRTRLELLKKCVALKENPTPAGHTMNNIRGEAIYRLAEPGARICYTIDATTIAILVVLVTVQGS